MIISNRAAGNSLPSCQTGTTKTSVIPNRDKYSGQDYVPPAQQAVNSGVDNTYKPNLWPQANMERMIARRRMASRSLEGEAGCFISQEKLIRFGGVPCINVAAAYCFYGNYGGEGGIVRNHPWFRPCGCLQRPNRQSCRLANPRCFSSFQGLTKAPCPDRV